MLSRGINVQKAIEEYHKNNDFRYSSNARKFNIAATLPKKLIEEQFPDFAHLTISPVKIQGHDNRTFRLGNDMLIRMPTAQPYALKVAKEQEFLPLLAPYLSIAIPKPIKMGKPSVDYPFNFSIYKWLDGESANSIAVDDKSLEHIALSLAEFLKELQSIDIKIRFKPRLHNWYRGDHVSVYDKQARSQIKKLKNFINIEKALTLWENATNTKWTHHPVWIHGDITSSNILVKNGRLSGIIDFGSAAVGDPACDLVIAWTLFNGKSREIFTNNVNVDQNSWVRARGWALWKATYELCNLSDKENITATNHRHIIDEVLND